jgi:phenylacetate-CoA ligase
MAGFLRPLAYDLLSRRDGYGDWTRHRNAFRALVTSTPEQVRHLALNRLRHILVHAYETVPYYRETWRAIGFVPSPYVTLEDLEQLPLLTQADIRTRKADIVSRRFQVSDLNLDYTGGTTGTHTSFYRDRACASVRFGRQWGILEHCGYRPGDKRALVWGAHADLATPGAGTIVKRWFRQFASAEQVICCTVMSRAAMLEYHGRLRAFAPRVMYGYPNAIEEFARFIRREGLSRIRVARVICMAEKLREHQRLLFQEVFGGEVFDLYGSREHGCVAFECSRHQALHVDTGNTLVEILRSGRPARPGESGELVITDLLNYGMPMIRHATGDMGTAPIARCECGCPLPSFSSLDGRVTDMVYRPDGSIVAGVMLVDLFMDQPAIAQAQFVQHDAGSLDVNLALAPGACADVRDTVIEELRSVLGPDMAIRVHFVTQIPVNPRSGKYQEVICRIDTPSRVDGAALGS